MGWAQGDEIPNSHSRKGESWQEADAFNVRRSASDEYKDICTCCEDSCEAEGKYPCDSGEKRKGHLTFCLVCCSYFCEKHIKNHECVAWD